MENENHLSSTGSLFSNKVFHSVKVIKIEKCEKEQPVKF